MTILKIGTWNSEGFPVDWHIERSVNMSEHAPEYVMRLETDGRVFVDRVEIVEWTQARREAMEKKP